MVLVSLFLILFTGGEPDPGQQEWTPSRENKHFSLDALITILAGLCLA